MELNFKKALNAPFSDENWRMKIGIAALVFLPGLVSALSFGAKNPLTAILYVAASFLTTGLAVYAAHNELHDKEPLLPEWDYVSFFITAFKLTLLNMGWIIMLLPFLILFGFLNIMNTYLTILVIILGIPIVIAFTVLLNISQSLFLINFSLLDGFKFEAIIQILKQHYIKYLFYIFAFVVLSIVFGIIEGITAGLFTMLINKDLGNYAAGVINVLFLITTFNLLAQTYKLTQVAEV